jgi:hypothetical protein
MPNFFTNNIPLSALTNGDISIFFDPSGLPLRGVCVVTDTAPAIPGVPGSAGLGESPSSGGATKDSLLHPSGFNQKRIISAYNPTPNGGTLFIGIDLPGGFDSPDPRSVANPSFRNDYPGSGANIIARDQVRPFDADGNGEPDFIGRSAVNGFVASCADFGPMGDCKILVSYSNGSPDIWNCSEFCESAGATDNPRGGVLGEEEFYTATVTFGGGQTVELRFRIGNATATNVADFSISNGGLDVGALVSATALNGAPVGTKTTTSGIPMGFDVVFAITNINAAVPNACDRNSQTITCRSGSNADGSGQGEDFNTLSCVYASATGSLVLTKDCVSTNVAPGGLFTFRGTVRNTGTVALNNVVVFNNQPVDGTLVATFATLAVDEVRTFTSSYIIPSTFKDCQITDTLTATATAALTCSPAVTNFVTQTCSLGGRLRIGCPLDVLVECPLDVPPRDPNSVVIKENNGGPVTVVFKMETNIMVGCTNFIFRTYVATNDCSSNFCVQTITVFDHTKPVLMGVPPNLNVQCLSDVLPPAAVIAMDNCDGQVPVQFTNTFSGPSTSCPLFITNTWTAMDKCKNISTAFQVIKVQDTTPPQLIGVPLSVNVQCIGDVPPPTDVRALDNCDGQVTVLLTTTNSGGFADVFNPANRLPCPLFITNTWTAMDHCSNKVSAVQIIKVQDTTKPVLMGVPSSLVFQCLDEVPQTVADVIAMDNCDGQVVVTNSTSNSGGFANAFIPTGRLPCPYYITNMWTAFDRCTNRATAVQIITVNDTTPPVLVGVPPGMNVQCITDVPPPTDVRALDNCDGQVTVSLTTTNNGGFTDVFNPTNRLPCPLFITNTWTAVDLCTNKVSAVQIIKVQDTIKPLLMGVPPSLVFQCIEEVPQTVVDVIGMDNCDGQVAVTFTVTNSGGFANAFNPTNRLPCPFYITNTWTAVDHCTNRATAVQVITVNDTIPPQLLGIPANMNVQCVADALVAADVRAIDNCDGQVLVTLFTTNSGRFVDVFNPTNRVPCPLFITNVWTAMDACSNKVSATQVIKVQDTIPPIISCPPNVVVARTNDIPPRQMTLDGFRAFGGSASDNCQITNYTSADSALITNSITCILNVFRTNTVFDICGNTASCVQIITVNLCRPDICVIKEVACSSNGACGPFSHEATGYKSADQNPAFCYRIVVTNCGNIDLTSLSMMDNQLGNISGSFPLPGGTLGVGRSVTNFFTRSWATDTFNMVTASARSVLDGTLVMSTDSAMASAMAFVRPASVSCGVTAFSMDDRDNNATNEVVVLRQDGLPHAVKITFTICNTGDAGLIVSNYIPALAGFGFPIATQFSLGTHMCTNLVYNITYTCPGPELRITDFVTGVVDTRNGICGFDINGRPITVTSTTPCTAEVSCTNCQMVCGSIAPCLPLYPFNSANMLTSVPFNESEVLRTNTLTIADGCVPTQIRVFYNDEHALTLGVNRLIVKNSAGAGGTITTDFDFTFLTNNPDSTLDPRVGDLDATDEAGRPLFPALFMTDLTTNANPLGGDWQFGGKAIPPHAVFGTWKGAVRTVDNTKSPATDTITPGIDPAKNNYNLGPGSDPVPAGLVNQGYGAEVRWDTDRLGLIPGHTYRLYFMVHDGDQNHDGGDVGQACATVVMGGEVDCGQAALGDFVWHDMNRNGMQDAGEPGISGATVQLLDCLTTNVLRTTMTGADGRYLFSGLAPGMYKVRFTPPSGFSFTTPNANGNTVDAVDSDADPVTGLTGCYTLFAGQTNLTVDAGVFQVPPGLLLFKSGSPSIVLPNASVTYSYTVTNTSGLTLNNVVVTDDNGTPGFVLDDVTVGTVAVLPPNGSATLSRMLILPVTLCDQGGAGLPSGMIIKEVLPNGNFRVSFIQDFGVNDNTYGVNAIGWGGPNGHKFSNLTGSDHVSWEFRNGAGQLVLAFDQDYISAASTALFPSGFGCLGFGGDGSLPSVGNAASVLDFSTSLEDNLNKQPFLGALAQYTVNSPSLIDPNSPFWEYRMVYTVILDKSAFGGSGLGAVAIVDQHNSPGKRRVTNPQPCDACVTNMATATAQAGALTMTANAFAKVCIDVPPLLAAIVAGESLALSWEDPSNAFRLQCSGTCSPSGAWTDMTNTPVEANGRKTVQVPMNDLRQFYRLIKN